MSSSDPIRPFFDDQTCLIAESSTVFIASVKACIKGLGLDKTKIITCTTFDEAMGIIASEKPRILISEYAVGGGGGGLRLAEAHAKLHADHQRIGIVISGNASDAAVAEAAEEQVDAFMVKPFSADDFKKRLLAVVDKKLFPSPYAFKLREAKELFANKRLPEALALFQEAKKLSQDHAMACFYAGECFRLSGDSTKALAEFRAGRAKTSLHYQCMIGEFEVLVAEKRYKEAHELIPTLIKNFPLTPSRLRQVYIAAVMSYNFDHLSDYFEQFQKLDSRPADLVKIVSRAYLTGAKWLLQKADKANLAKASEFLDKAYSVSGRDMTVGEEVIGEFVRLGEANEAQAFLKKMAPDHSNTPAFNRLVFQVDFLVSRPDQILERGRKSLASNELTPDLLLKLVKLSAENGKEMLAESFIAKALSIDPNLREVLYKTLKENLVVRQSNSG